MENKKYRNPAIEEFHVGFECERRNIDFKWEKCVISVFQLHEILDEELNDCFEPAYYRVEENPFIGPDKTYKITGFESLINIFRNNKSKKP